jgi:hypothetical protein
MAMSGLAPAQAKPPAAFQAGLVGKMTVPVGSWLKFQFNGPMLPRDPASRVVVLNRQA